MSIFLELNLQDVVSIIRGKKGTPVHLKLMRDNPNGTKKIFTVRLIRSTIDLKEEEARVFHQTKNNQNISIIKVPSFYGSGSFGRKSVSRDVRKILQNSKVQRADAVILDLSNNRGGSLDEAITLTGFFFSKGNVVKQSEKRSGTHHIFKDRDSSILYRGPIVVLVNRLSASASEIVSGTLQDYKRALIVGGDHTFGKGSVQSVEHLPFKLGAIKATVGLYFIPNGSSTQNQGVVSDIPLPSIFNIDDIGEKTLDYALPKKRIKDFRSSKKEIFAKNPTDAWQPITYGLIKKLKKSSKKRVAKNAKFKKIVKRLTKIKKKKKKAVSVLEILNEKSADVDLKKEREKLLSSSKAKKKKNYLERADVEEALHIAMDLARFQKRNSAKK